MSPDGTDTRTEQTEHPTFPKWYLLNIVAGLTFLALGGLAVVGMVYDPPTQVMHRSFAFMMMASVFSALTAYLLLREP